MTGTGALIGGAVVKIGLRVNTLTSAINFTVSTIWESALAPAGALNATGFDNTSSAPALIASKAFSTSAADVTPTIGVGLVAMICRTASTPSTLGMLRSIVMTSGFNLF